MMSRIESLLNLFVRTKLKVEATMKSYAIMAVCAVSALFVAKPLVAEDVIWNVTADDPDNVLSNEVHFVPTLAEIQRTDSLSLTATSDMTVRMPASSDWSVPFGLKFYAASSHSLTLDFAGATLTQPDATNESPYIQDGRFCLGLSSLVFQYAWPGKPVNGTFRIEDGLLTITNNIAGVDSVDFWRGTWDFLAPNATTNSGAYLYIAYGGTSTRTFRMNFHPGSELRAPIFFIYGNAKTNEINVLGGSHYMAKLQTRNRGSGGIDPYARTRVNVLGADTRLTINTFEPVNSEHLQGYRIYVADGATLISTGNIFQRPNAGHNFVFDNATFETGGRNIIWESMSVFATNSKFTVASPSLRSGRMELKDSTWTSSNPAIGFTAGRKALLRIDGGKFNAAKMYFGTEAAGATGVVEVASGEVALSGGVSLVTANGSVGVLVLEGGVVETPVVAGDAGCNAYDSTKTGIAMLHANGGTLRASKSSDGFIKYLSSATCGAKGLKIESNYDITIPQSFANADGESGELILAGSGVKTLSGSATSVSKIIVTEGTVVFATGSRAASEVVVTNGARVVFAESPSTVGITGFVCGDASSAGIITVAPASLLDFGSAAVTFNNVKLLLDGEFAIGSSYELIRSTATVSDKTKAAWITALNAAGFADNASYAFDVSESGGTVSFNMSVSQAERTFSVLEGSQTVVEDVAVGNLASIVADLSPDTSLTFEGELSGGILSKTGSGRLFLENDNNSFTRGVVSSGGLLSVASIGAIGISDFSSLGLKLMGGTFEYRGDGTSATLPGALHLASPSVSSPIGLKIDSPLTVCDITVDGGAIIKRGKAPLTLNPPSGATVNLAPSNGSNVGGDPSSPYSIGDLSDNSGALPTSGYLGFNIAEGEVRLVGDADTTFLFHTAMIGVSALNGLVQPSLTIDGAKADFSIKQMNVHLCGFTQAGSFNVAPTLSISNGANVIMHNFTCGRNAGVMHYPTVTVDRATWTVKNFNASYNWNSRPTYFFRNGAVVNTDKFLCYGPSYLIVTNSVVGKNAAGECATAEFHDNGGNWFFGEGSTLALSAFKTDSTCKGFTLSFDGGTWETGGSTDVLHLYRAEIYTFKTLGSGGLTLPVADGKTLAVGRAISGDGGIVKTGPGTLAFETQGTWDEALTQKTELDDPVSLAFAGELDVREGTVTVASGACRSGGAYRTSSGASIDFGSNTLGMDPVFSGGGTFANASVGNCTLIASLKGDSAANFSDFAFGGRIRVKFDELVALEAESITVATFSDNVPDLSKFYSRKLGNFYRAEFFVDGAAVKARIARSGASVIIK